MDNSKILRIEILDLVGKYIEGINNQEKIFIPTKTHVPVSGKLIGVEEIQFAVDACRSIWIRDSACLPILDLRPIY